MQTQVIELSNPLWLQTLQTLPHDVYHLPEYLYLEAVRTHTKPQAIIISIGSKIMFLPYLLRKVDNLFEQYEISEDFWDIVSPYGYPGIIFSPDAYHDANFIEQSINQLIAVLDTQGVCSAFLRLHPLLNQGLHQVLSSDICQVTGETISVDLTLSEAEIWQQTRPEHRNHINRCKRSGFTARMADYCDYIDEFVLIYTETMDRVEAQRNYYFNSEYFNNLASLKEKIHLCIIEWNNQVVCASLFTECCGIFQYHLGGTKGEFLKQAPSKLMHDYARFWAKGRGNKEFHMGGGLGGSKDSLYHFKAGFSKQSYPFLTLRLIPNQDRYKDLVELRAKVLNTQSDKLLESTFFPAYRATSN